MNGIFKKKFIISMLTLIISVSLLNINSVQARADVGIPSGAIDLNTVPPNEWSYPHYLKIVNASVLNVRRGYGTNYDIIGSVYYGEAVVDIGSIGDWTYICYSTSNGQKVGWVYRYYLKDIP